MIDRTEIQYTSAYKTLNQCRNTYAVSSPDGAKRHMVSGPPPRHTFITDGNTPPLPGLSSMLQHQRSLQDGFILSPPSPLSNKDEQDKLQYKTVYRLNNGPVENVAPVSNISGSPTPIPSSNLPVTVSKSSRYLREMDRQAILLRIAQGEKQSALAKEYQVSRAAICNLNKHRDEVLSRKNGNPLAKHPKKPRPKVIWKKPHGNSTTILERTSPNNNTISESTFLYEIKSRAAVLLLTTLRQKYATTREFRRSSDRLMRILMEEALAHVPMKPVEIVLPNHSKSDGIILKHPPCVISMEPVGCPMLDLFHLIEPDQPTGYVSFDMAISPSDLQSHDVQAKICGRRLPDTFNYHNIFLMDHVITSAEVVIAVVKRLQEYGAMESMISLVALIATSEAVKKVHAVFPALKIIVVQVDNGADETVLLTGYGHSEVVQIPASTTDMILDRLEQVYHGLSSTNAY